MRILGPENIPPDLRVRFKGTQSTLRGADNHAVFCRDESGRDGNPHGGYVCTREPGHQGLHVGHFSADQICGIWGDEDPDLVLPEGL